MPGDMTFLLDSGQPLESVLPQKEMIWQIWPQTFGPDKFSLFAILVYQFHSSLYSAGLTSSMFAPSYVAPFI